MILLDDSRRRQRPGHDGCVRHGACLRAGLALSTRILIPRSRYDETVTAIGELFGSITPGPPTVEGTTMGPLIDLRQRDRRGLCAVRLDEGARIVCGGARPRDSTEALYLPHCSPTSRPRCGWLARRSSAPCSSPSPTTTTMTPCASRTTRSMAFPGMSSAPTTRALAVARRIRTGTMSVNGGVWYSADVRSAATAIRHRTRNGCRRLRGVPGDQGTRPTSTRKCTMTVHGYIGLGMMGSAMCERLATSGAAVLAHDLNPAAVDAAVERGRPQQAPRGGRRAGRHHQHVCPAAAHLDAVIDELATVGRAGQILLIHSTVHPERSAPPDPGGGVGGLVFDAAVAGGDEATRRGELRSSPAGSPTLRRSSSRYSRSTARRSLMLDPSVPRPKIAVNVMTYAQFTAAAIAHDGVANTGGDHCAARGMATYRDARGAHRAMGRLLGIGPEQSRASSAPCSKPRSASPRKISSWP